MAAVIRAVRVGEDHAPFTFLGAAPYSATIRGLYSGLKDRRFGRGAGSDSAGSVTPSPGA
jgi:hypothetical protein